MDTLASRLLGAFANWHCIPLGWSSSAERWAGPPRKDPPLLSAAACLASERKEIIGVSHPDILIRHQPDDVEATMLLRRITGDPEEESLWKAIDAAVDEAALRRVTLHFQNVQYISSLGIGRLVTFAKGCRAKNVRVVILDLCPSLEQVFRLMRLDAFVEIDLPPLNVATFRERISGGANQGRARDATRKEVYCGADHREAPLVRPEPPVNPAW